MFEASFVFNSVPVSHAGLVIPTVEFLFCFPHFSTCRQKSLMLNLYTIFIPKVYCRQLLIPFVILNRKFWLCNKTLEKQSYFCFFPWIDFPNNNKNNISARGFIKCVQSIETLIPICMLKMKTFFCWWDK